MKVLILNQDEVVRLLPMKDCIAAMREALIALASGKAHQPLRTIVRPPEAAGVMGLMPSYVAADGDSIAAFGLKTVCVFPANPAQGKDAHQGAVLLFSGETGELMAIMNASAITAIRTAAVSAVATEVLARPDAGRLAIIGSGVQARSHLAAMSEVRAIKHCRIVSRSLENAQRLVEEKGGDFPFPLEAVKNVEQAVANADLIVTATNSAEPVLQRSWISSGAHLNVVGSSTPKAREVDTATMAEASLFVDRRESTLNEAGDYLLAAREGAIGQEDIRAELGEVLTGEKPGRTTAEEITLFKSLGLAIEDLFVVQHLFAVAQQQSVGTWVDF